MDSRRNVKKYLRGAAGKNFTPAASAAARAVLSSGNVLPGGPSTFTPMKSTLLHSLSRRAAGALLLASVCLSGRCEVHAAAIVTGNAAFNVSTSDYTYSYSIMNTGLSDDLAIVTLPVFSPLGVSSLFAPSGFSLTFDPSQHVVNFIEDGSILTSQTFSPGSTVGTFSFNSVMGPGSAAFVAYDASGTEFTGTTIAPVPEPAGSLLAAFTAAGLLLRRRRSL